MNGLNVLIKRTKIGKESKGEGRKPINMLFMRNNFKTISRK